MNADDLVAEAKAEAHALLLLCLADDLLDVAQSAL